MRKLCWFALPFAVSVLAAVYLLPEGWFLPAAGLCALFALPGLLLKEKRRIAALLAAAGLTAGLVWSAGWSWLFREPLLALDGQTLAFSGTVADWPRETAYGGSVLLEAEFSTGEKGKLVLYCSETPDCVPGDTLAGTARLSRADRYSDDTHRSTYSARGIFLSGRLRGELTAVPADRTPVHLLPILWAGRMREGAEVFPEDVRGLMIALTTGERKEISDLDYAALQRAGLAHTVAVSGMHISVLVGTVVLVLGRGKRSAALAGMALAILFAAMTGASPSAVRAAILQIFLLGAPMLGREEDRPTMLSAALLILLLYNPWSIARVSLQLSFLSVAGIYLLSWPIRSALIRRLPKKAKSVPGRLALGVVQTAAAALAVTLSAQLFTLPLSAYYFGAVSLISPLANLLALWAVELAFVGGLPATLLGMLFPAAGGALAWLVAWPARWVLLVARTALRIPFAAVPVSSPYLLGWLAVVYGVAVICLLGKGGKRLRVTVPALAVTLAAALAFQNVQLPPGAASFAVLDVGQGLSVAVVSQGRAMLVDCGGSGLRSAGDVAADHFQSLGIYDLDLLVLTHFHADHANGVEQLLERMDVGLLAVPDAQQGEPMREAVLAAAAEHGVETIFLTDNADVTLGDADVDIYAPLGDGGANEEGLSVLCTSGGFDALITGDMNAVVERRLLKYGALPDIELLVVGHHGSKYSTCEELLADTRPEYAVISVGRNSYGHPAEETLVRLARAGCEIYRTDTMGTVRLTAKDPVE